MNDPFSHGDPDLRGRYDRHSVRDMASSWVWALGGLFVLLIIVAVIMRVA